MQIANSHVTQINHWDEGAHKCMWHVCMKPKQSFKNPLSWTPTCDWLITKVSLSNTSDDFLGLHHSPLKILGLREREPSFVRVYEEGLPSINSHKEDSRFTQWREISFWNFRAVFRMILYRNLVSWELSEDKPGLFH
jgi:hypothetical protein